MHQYSPSPQHPTPHRLAPSPPSHPHPRWVTVAPERRQIGDLEEYSVSWCQNNLEKGKDCFYIFLPPFSRHLSSFLCSCLRCPPPWVTNHLGLSGTIWILEPKILFPGIAFRPRQTRTVGLLTPTQPCQNFYPRSSPDSTVVSSCHFTSIS